MKAKLMKIIIIAVLMVLSHQSYAVEFHQCIDQKGQQHFTNLPPQSLGSNCKETTDRYSYLINQDYSNLEKRYQQVVLPDETDQLNEPLLNLNSTEKELEQVNDPVLPINPVMKPILDVIDPDNVLEEVNRTKSQSKSILSEDKTGALTNDT